MPPRPKPWETTQTGGGSGTNATAGPSTSAFDSALAASTSANTTAASSNTAPRIPDRPAGLDSLSSGETSRH